MTPASEPDYPQRMALRVRRADGSEHRDAISELLKYLRFRYELSERALVHHTKLAADAMVGKTLEMYHDALWIDHAKRTHPKLRADTTDITAFKAHFRSAFSAKKAEVIDKTVKDSIEDLFLVHGDDGLLEHLYALAQERSATDSRWAGIQALVGGLLERRLFKRIALTSDNAEAKEIYGLWGHSPESRRNLERAVARAAEIDPAWQVLAWIPPPKMRLKAALVLVDDQGRIKSFVKREVSHPRHRGEDIYNAHMDLWAASVFIAPAVADGDVRPRIVARMAEMLPVEKWDDPKLPTSLRQVALDSVCREEDLKQSQREGLEEAAPAFYGGRAADERDWTFSEITGELKLINRELADGGRDVSGADLDDDVPRLL